MDDIFSIIHLPLVGVVLDPDLKILINQMEPYCVSENDSVSYQNGSIINNRSRNMNYESNRFYFDAFKA